MSEFTYVEATSLETADLLLDRAISIIEKYIDDRTRLHRISIVLSEAITNACIHGNRLDREKSVTLTIRINESSLIADIIDQGTGGLQRIQNRLPSEQLAESGRGIDLIRHYAENAVFTAEENGGLRVSIAFPLHDKSKAMQ